MVANFVFNRLIATLKPQSNGPSYSNTVIGTLAVDGWDVSYIWYSEEGTARPGRSCTKCNSPPINGQCIIRCGSIIAFGV